MRENDTKLLTEAEISELMSALMDGEIQDAELAVLLRALNSRPELMTKWQSFNVIGSALHDPNSLSAKASLSFQEKVSAALALDANDSNNKVSASSKVSHIKDFSKSGAKPSGPVAKLSTVTDSLSKLAVAASIMFVSVFGWYFSIGDSSELNLAINEVFNIGDETTVATNNISGNVPGKASSRPANVGAKIIAGRAAQNRVLVNAGASGLNANTGEVELKTYLSEERLQQYMLVHAENASLNINQGMLPFARVSHVETKVAP